ncbi:hypothetical protein B0J14DRAFT_579283 [Halenospora varia]|nr:hypothetical protein B0J14DRAFT_579283 [Halenospora varia]
MTPHDWHIIVEEYTGRMLTEESDKLPALGGLAAIYQFTTQDQYLFGLWRDSLVAGLLWFQRHLLYAIEHHEEYPSSIELHRSRGPP